MERKWLEAIGEIETFCLSKSKFKMDWFPRLSMDWFPRLSKSKFKMDWLLYAGATAKPLTEW